MIQEDKEKYPTKEEPDIEFIKLVIGDNVKELNKLHYERRILHSRRPLQG